jgi:hypothetical protein
MLYLSTPIAALAIDGNCCLFATEIGSGVAALALDTSLSLGSDVPAARKAALAKALGKAQEFLATGVTEGTDTCDTTKAKQKFQYARGWLVNYKEILADLGLSGSDLDLTADELIAQIDDLIAGVCEGGSGGSNT